MLDGSDVIAAEMKEVVALIVVGGELLRLAGRFELFHLPLSLARWLVRISALLLSPLCWRCSILA